MYVQMIPEKKLAEDSAMPKAIPAYIGLPGSEVVLKQVTHDPKKQGMATTTSKNRSLSPFFSYITTVNDVITD